MYKAHSPPICVGGARYAVIRASSLPSAVAFRTIKKFELTGQISLRQFLLLWQSLDDLQALYVLTTGAARLAPQSIEDVLNDPL